jgi:hypothetical protein
MHEKHSIFGYAKNALYVFKLHSHKNLINLNLLTKSLTLNTFKKEKQQNKFETKIGFPTLHIYKHFENLHII